MKENIITEAFADTLEFLAFKMRNGTATACDIDSLSAILKSDVCVLVTVKELAEYYGKTEDQVRHVIHRKVAKPPVRRVFYDFLSFQKVVPPKWHRKTYDSDN